jgi:hypothetical protein
MAEHRLLVSLAARIVPASAALDGAGRAEMLALIDDTVASRAPAMRRQFHAFLALLRWSPVLRYLRPIDRLDGSRQDAVLRWFQTHPLQLIRGGLWGVRTIVLLGVYGRPDAGSSIAYTPSRNGNAVLHARARR